MADRLKERADAPWWNPFAPRTLWCERSVEQGDDRHVCERGPHALDRPHLCSCGLTWTA